MSSDVMGGGIISFIAASEKEVFGNIDEDENVVLLQQQHVYHTFDGCIQVSK